ncbi:hypothetical protein D9Q98_003645 [Chlorella vulgaris]|uniref:FAD dependent oxidoreductase domain-containing protein n=1 Tax=Chlorella vulgaris TaxID=3077 RepID=A0A9D4TT52_CHLVU|nr:hypothetical protein D9Q98_003645 [Chlorella vulgaris]
MVSCSAIRGSTLRVFRLRRGARARMHIAATSVADAESRPARVAVIGGGFAGLAVSWHLLSTACNARPVQLHLFDAYGLGAGGSGAAAGLLHPYTARGKTLWRGLEAFQEATALLEAAEAAAAATTAGQAPGIRKPFVWRHGMLRASRSAKQARDVARFLPADPQAAAAAGAEVLLDAAAMAALVPGLQPEQLLLLDQQQQLAGGSPPPPAAVEQPPRQRQQGAAVHPPAAGLLVHGGVTLHPGSYIQALWAACQLAAARAGPGSEATLHLRAVPSLRELTDAEGHFDAVVVAAGAAVESIAELRGLLPLDLCHGHSLEMRSGGSGSSSSSSSSDNIGSSSSSSDNIGSSSSDNTSSSSSSDGSSSSSRSGDSAAGGLNGYPAGAPSLLGSPYIAAHGSHSVVVGATKRYGLTAAEAYRQCSSPLVTDAAEAQAAAEALLPAARVLWPPLAGWQVASVRAGVRAIPARGAAGSIPYAGKLPTQQHLPSCWVIGGLGARGLVYHAWLGKLVAAAAAMSFARSFARNRPLNYFFTVVVGVASGFYLFNEPLKQRFEQQQRELAAQQEAEGTEAAGREA